jgi:signal transduction histidine kinase
VSGAESDVLAEEQAALRRVAMLVALGVPPDEVFAAVTVEVVRLLPVDFARMGRYEADGTVTTVAASSKTDDHLPASPRLAPGWKHLGRLVAQTCRSARVDSGADASGPDGVSAQQAGVRSAVATPIIVEGRLWGVMAAGSTVERLLPADTEARLASFTELVATAMSNAESRAALARLAEEQAALRRVATLVAHATPPEQVLAAVAEEVGGLLEVDYTVLIRSDPEDMITVVGAWTAAGGAPPSRVGSRFEVGGRNVSTLALRTGRPARLDAYADVTGSIGNTGAHDWGFRSSVGVPISVEGQPWGLILVAYSRDQQLPADTEARLASFTELVATAISNAESRAALAASRARIVAAADETRRRIERDLHDGTQQQLVSLMLELRSMQAAVPAQLGELGSGLGRVAEGLGGVFDRVREISHGIHPAILSERGLRPALMALGRRSVVPVELDLRAERRLAGPVEVAAYYTVSEALANAAKHAQASVVRVELDTSGTIMRLTVRDDGVGGADPARGSGLMGLRDRIEALGGTLEVISPVGGGTMLLIEIPAEGQDAPTPHER